MNVEKMTLLDYMAGQALSKISTDDYSPKPETIAKLAYKIATAMLKEKERIESEQSK